MTLRTASRSLAATVELDTDAKGSRIIYWHRELPPFDAEATGEHVVEAASGRVPGTLAHRDELWSQCYEGLMAQVRVRLEHVRIVTSETRATSCSTDSPCLNEQRTVALPAGLFLPHRAGARIPFAAVTRGSR